MKRWEKMTKQFKKTNIRRYTEEKRGYRKKNPEEVALCRLIKGKTDQNIHQQNDKKKNST